MKESVKTGGRASRHETAANAAAAQAGEGLSRSQLFKVWGELLQGPRPPKEGEQPAADSGTEPAIDWEHTQISRHTKIYGDICCDSDMTIQGQVRGTVQCAGSLRVLGVVEGNLYAQYIVLEGAGVRGELTGECAVVVEPESAVVGDIESEDIVISGKVHGMLRAAGHVMLKSGCYVAGDISCSDFMMEEGALLDGTVKITAAESTGGFAAPQIEVK